MTNTGTKHMFTPNPVTAAKAPAYLERLISIHLGRTLALPLDVATVDRVCFLAEHARSPIATLRRAMSALGIATVDTTEQPPVPVEDLYFKAIEDAIGDSVAAWMEGKGPQPQQSHLNDARKALADFRGAYQQFAGYASSARPAALSTKSASIEVGLSIGE